MTRDEMEEEASQLLLEQRRLARLGLKLGPKAFQRLKSLLLRLGYTRSVPMSRSPHVTRRLKYKAPLVVSYAKPPARPPHPDMPPQRTPTDLITHAAHALNNPTDSTAIRAFADHLMETHPDDPHAQAFIEWVNGGEWSGQRWKGAMYHPRGENLGSEGVTTEPYFTLNPRRVITPGFAYKGDDSTQPLGLLAKRLNSPLWEFRSRMPRKTIASPLDGIEHSATAPARRIPKMTSTEVAQHLYDVDGVRGLAIAVIGARHFHPDVTPPTPNTYTPSRPKFTRRRVSVKFAKAETTRHPAHPLIAGFPLEHALRHMANDASRSDNVRELSKRALTTGDTSALWGLHDAAQEDGKGVPGGYNLMSAADKIHLDAHTHKALREVAEDKKVGVPPEYHDDWTLTPEHQAERAEQGLRKGDARANHWLRQDRELGNRIRSRVGELSPGIHPKLIDESIRRHAHRASRLWAERTGGGVVNNFQEQALRNPKEDTRTPEHQKTVVATRYARLTVRPGEPLMGGSDFMHEVHDEGGNRVGHIWVTPQQNGTHLHVNHVGLNGHTPNSAGLDVVRQVRAQLKAHYPTAKTIGGTRISGAVRANTGKVRPTSRPLARRKVVVRYAKPNCSDFLDALRRMKSSNHTALTTAAVDVAGRMGMGDTKVLPALHDTPHGAVPGVAQAVYGQVRPESVHALAAWVNGLLPNGPGYAVFHPRPTGPDTLYRIRHEGSGMDLRVRLDRAGITSRVLVPHRKGFDILIPDKGNALSANVEAYSKQHGLAVEASPGHFQTVGSPDQGQARATMRNKVVQGERPTQQRRGRKVRRYQRIGQLTPEQLQIAESAAENKDRTGWGALGDHMQESGLEGAGGVLSRVAEGHPTSNMIGPVRGNHKQPNGYYAYFPTSGESGATYHRLEMKVGGNYYVFTHREDPQKLTRVSSPKKYAEVPTKEGEEWIKDFKVPVYYDAPRGGIGISHYAPKRGVDGRWAWNQLEHLGHAPDVATVKNLFPNAMHEDEFLYENPRRGKNVNGNKPHYLTPEEVHLATDGREGTAPKALPTAQSHEDQGADANTGGVSYPEDFYAMTRRRAVKYAKVPNSEFGTLTPEQLAIAERAYATGEPTAWGALGDHFQENGFPNAGAMLSRHATGDSSVIYKSGGYGLRERPHEKPNTFSYRVLRDGADLVHQTQVFLPNGLVHSFVSRETPKRRPEPDGRYSAVVRRRRALTCR